MKPQPWGAPSAVTDNQLILVTNKQKTLLSVLFSWNFSQDINNILKIFFFNLKIPDLIVQLYEVSGHLPHSTYDKTELSTL